MHFVKVATALMLGLFVGMGVALSVAAQVGPASVESLLPLVLFGFLFYRMFWCAQPVYAAAQHLEIGSGRAYQRVPLADVVSAGRPWWALVEMFFVPMRIRFKNRRSVLVYPSQEGAEFLRDVAARNRGQSGRAPVRTKS